MTPVFGISMMFALVLGPGNGQSAPDLSVLKGVSVTQNVCSAEKATARCRYRCKCRYVNRRKAPCHQTFLKDCPGRRCGRCVGAAEAKARRKCKVRGPVRKCTCTFKKIRQKP